MKKYALLLLTLLVGCSDASTKESTEMFAMPEELSECQMFELHKRGTAHVVYLVKCPEGWLGTTTYQGTNKNTTSSTSAVY